MAATDEEEVAILRKRLEFLEQINQQYISTLDTLNSLGDIHGNVKQKRSPQHIFASTRQYICRLVQFDLTAFLMVNDENNSFDIEDCMPLDTQSDLQILVDNLIESGEFGWALNQSRICEPQIKLDDRSVLLHVLASRTRIRGMFIGVLNKNEPVPSAMTLGLISAILYNSAYALESAALYKMVIKDNEELETKVIERTKALKQAQMELKVSNEELERRVKIRTVELSSANKKLLAEVERRIEIENSLRQSEDELITARKFAESANQAKSDFLSNMSHELRTPLNAILGFSQIMELSEEFMLTENGYYVDEIRTAGEHLLELINEVLDLSKIEAGKVEVNLENINLGEVLRECYALVKPLASKKNIQLKEFPGNIDNIFLYVDRTLVKQVFINVLSNAVKYNTEDGHVELKVNISESMIEVMIIDTGIGIKEDMQQFMFQPFNRLGVECSEVEGTGIGMVITKHLVLLMGGEIEFNSKVGSGTEFSIKFAAGFSSFGPAKNRVNTAHELVLDIDSFTVLYVEDNLPNIRLLESILSKWSNISLISAVTAEEGIELAQQMKPDVIIMDINLPKMDGYEALKVLKAGIDTSGIPVVALSANAMQNSEEKDLGAGFERYLTKPLKVVEFLKLLGNLTGQVLLK